MPSIVTLDIFSGLPNPTWVLSDEQVRELQQLLSKGPTTSPIGSLPLLGYRGFVVRPIESSTTPSTRLEGATESAAGAGDAVVSHSPDAEEFLLRTAASAIDEDLQRHVQDVIASGPAPEVLRQMEAATTVSCPSCNAADAPAYNPGYWNTPARQPNNNCYNYANDQATNTFAQPGRATGRPITALSCAGVQPSATSDGLRACGNFSGQLGTGQGWYVALVIWPGRDYHWYRQDKVGCWSHKPGSTPARNTDNSGNAITDPRTCNRGNYTIFCTYMITTRKVTIR